MRIHIRMRIRLRVHMRVRMRIRMRIQIHIDKACTYTYTYILTSTPITHTHIHTCTCTHIHTHIYIHTPFIHIHIHMHMCMHMHKHIHVHTDTQAHKHGHINMSMHRYGQKQIQRHMRMQLQIQMQVRMRMHMGIHVQSHIHAHAYTHTSLWCKSGCVYTCDAAGVSSGKPSKGRCPGAARKGGARKHKRHKHKHKHQRQRSRDAGAAIMHPMMLPTGPAPVAHAREEALPYGPIRAAFEKLKVELNRALNLASTTPLLALAHSAPDLPKRCSCDSATRRKSSHKQRRCARPLPISLRSRLRRRRPNTSGYPSDNSRRDTPLCQYRGAARRCRGPASPSRRPSRRS